MSEESSNSVPGGDEAQAGGEGQKSDFVGIDSYTKAVDEAKSAKRREREILAELNEYKAREQQLNEQKMLEEKNFSELLAQHKEKIQDLEGQVSQHVKDKIDFRKMNTALSLLQQKGINLESKYLDLIPLDQIELTESGDIDATSVADVVEGFQKEHPRLVVPQARLLPNQKSANSDSKLSVEDWKALTKRDPEAGKKALKEKRVKFDF